MFYVYELADPRNAEVFYIGKGKGSRLSQHERAALRGAAGAKCDRIREILATGQKLIARKVALFENEQDAFADEARRIAEGGDGLLNIMAGGFGGRSRRTQRDEQTREAKALLKKLAIQIRIVEQVAEIGGKVLLGRYDITKACLTAIRRTRELAHG